MVKAKSKISVVGLVLTITILALVATNCNKQDYIQSGNISENSNSNVTDARGPVVPANLVVPAGNMLIRHLYATGVQIYRCNGTAWTFVGPVANLYADAGYNGLVGTHYAGPRWESNSGSIVRGAVDQSAPSPDPNAIPWLLLHAVETSGAGIFADVTFIQRVNTTGGRAPTTGCDSSHIGTEVSIPYTAEYYFYKAQNSGN